MTTFTLVIAIKIIVVVIIFMYSQSSRNWPPREFIKLLAPRAKRLDGGMSFALCCFNLFFLIIGLKRFNLFYLLNNSTIPQVKETVENLLSGDITTSTTFSLNFPGLTIILLRLLIIIAECESGSKAFKMRGSELWNSRVIFIIEPVLMWKPWSSPL